jgi:hypothetical protein
MRIGDHRLLATRIARFKSIGDFPDFIYFGGNSEMRGYDYLQFAGQNVVFANAELRFPLIEAALTPIGVIGGIRGVFFANIGGGWFNGQTSAAATNGCGDPGHVQVPQQRPLTCRPVIGYVTDAAGFPVPDRQSDDGVCGVGVLSSGTAPDDRVAAPPAGRAGLVRNRARDLRARLPDPLRLVVAHPVEQELGRRRLRAEAAARRSASTLLDLDRLRLLDTRSTQRRAELAENNSAGFLCFR